MKKHLSIIVAFILISVIFLSGCTEEGIFSAFEGAKPKFEEFSCDKTTGENPLTVRFTSKGVPQEGDDIFYNWDFGDGEVTDKQNPTHTFYKPGIYVVKLTIRDSEYVTNQKSVQIIVTQANSLPVITASANPKSGRAPLTVSFTSSATDDDGTIESYSWDFGDGETSNEQNPMHTYELKSNYLAVLTVTDNNGGTNTKNIWIYAKGNTPPIAKPTADKTSGSAPLTVKFTSSASDIDGTVISYSWDFKDGSTSTQQNPTHLFNAVGTYQVILTVEDNEGATGTFTVTIKVSATEDPGGEDPYEDPYEDPAPPDTTTYTFSPVDDAYVDSDKPDKTFGTKDKNFLDVKSYPSEWIDDHYVYSYLKFDLTSLSDDADIYDAKLRLYIYSSFNIISDPYIRIHRVDDNSWDESTITYNNQPYLYSGYIDSIDLDATDDYLEWDITSYVKYHPGEKISLRISAYEDGNVKFYSQECMGLLADEDEKPILKLEVAE